MPGILQAIATFKAASGGSGWSFRSVGSNVTGASPTVPLPAGHTSGDLLVIAMVAGTVNVTTPAGWSVALNSTTAPRTCVFYKFDGGSETNVAITGGAGASNAVMLCWTGGTALDVNGTSSTTLTTNSLTTLAANDLVISVFGNTTQAATWTAPASTTTRYDGSAIVSTVGLLVVDEIQAGAGATTTRTATATSSTTVQCMASSFKL